MRGFIRQLAPAVIGVLAFTVLCGIVYPLVVTGIAQVAFHDKANGSLVKVDGQVVGSSLIGQQFSDPGYFHPRPSAAGTGYDGFASSFSNLGPTNPNLLSSVEDRVAAYREENGLAAGQAVPVDAVTASASGLDPDISVANAKLQAARVAKARGLAGRPGADAGRPAHDRSPVGLPRRARGERAPAQPRPRRPLRSGRCRERRAPIEAWPAARLPRRRARRRQDLRHARRGLAPQGAGRRRRRRLRRDPPSAEDAGAGPRPRGGAAAAHGVPGDGARGDGRRRRPRPPPRRGARRRAGPHERARQSSARSAGRTSRSCWRPAST